MLCCLNRRQTYSEQRTWAEKHITRLQSRQAHLLQTRVTTLRLSETTSRSSRRRWFSLWLRKIDEEDRLDSNPVWVVFKKEHKYSVRRLLTSIPSLIQHYSTTQSKESLTGIRKEKEGEGGERQDFSEGLLSRGTRLWDQTLLLKTNMLIMQHLLVVQLHRESDGKSLGKKWQYMKGFESLCIPQTFPWLQCVYAFAFSFASSSSCCCEKNALTFVRIPFPSSITISGIILFRSFQTWTRLLLPTESYQQSFLLLFLLESRSSLKNRCLTRDRQEERERVCADDDEVLESHSLSAFSWCSSFSILWSRVVTILLYHHYMRVLCTPLSLNHDSSLLSLKLWYTQEKKDVLQVAPLVFLGVMIVVMTKTRREVTRGIRASLLH